MRHWKYSTLEMDEPRDDEVQVRIVAAGICRTDLDVRDGHLPTPLPVVLGHEGAGIVDKVGAAVDIFPGGGSRGAVDGSLRRMPVLSRSGQPAFCVESCADQFWRFTNGRLGVPARSGEDPVHSHFFAQSSHATYAIAHKSSLVKVPVDVDLKLLLAPWPAG